MTALIFAESGNSPPSATRIGMTPLHDPAPTTPTISESTRIVFVHDLPSGNATLCAVSTGVAC
jgi:hypothetical protein